MGRFLTGLALAAVVVFAAVLQAQALSDDEKAAARVIVAMVKADKEFPETKDVNSVMKYYHPQYIGISNISKTRQSYDTLKASYAGRKKSGGSLGDGELKVDKIGKLKARVEGEFGWIVYEGPAHATMNGEFLRLHYRCTSVLKKTSGSWLVIHEHVSIYPEVID